MESHAIPVVSIAFAFRGGMALDPADKAGLTEFAVSTLDEGAGPLDSQAFQKELANNAIELGFTADRDAIKGQLKTLSDSRDKAFDLLHLALTQARFDAEPVERVRLSILAKVKNDLADPNWIAQRIFNGTVFEGQPYGQPGYGTPATLSRITVDDLKGVARDRLARDRLLVSVTGDITPAQLQAALDRIFADLPATGAAAIDVPKAELKAAGKTILLNRPLPQTVVLMGEAGVPRKSKDWYVAQVMNYVLGGGGFSSRLMEEVRAKRGLTYGVYTGLQPMRAAAMIVAQASTKNATAGEALDLIRAEWQRMADGGITAAELTDAKTYLTGSLPLQLTSTSAVANTLLTVQLDELGIDYLDRRNELLNRVTAQDVARVAKQVLKADQLTTVLVGQPQKVKPTETIEQPPGL